MASPDNHQVQACPFCDASGGSLRRRGSTDCRTRESGKNWYCRDCQRFFDEPKRRPSKRAGNWAGSQTARTLLEMEAGEV